MIRHYLFEDLETGELFIVGEASLHDAWDVAREYFAEPDYQYEMSEFEAESSGLDEY